MTQKLLQLELDLLTLEHGYDAIVEALASSKGTTVEAVEEEIRKLRNSKSIRRSSKSKKQVHIRDILSQATDSYSEPVRHLIDLYREGLFLPALSDVRRFLEQRKMSWKSLKSRKQAITAVTSCLVTMPDEELVSFAHAAESRRHGGDLGVLTKAILGH